MRLETTTVQEDGKIVKRHKLDLSRMDGEERAALFEMIGESNTVNINAGIISSLERVDNHVTIHVETKAAPSREDYGRRIWREGTLQRRMGSNVQNVILVPDLLTETEQSIQTASKAYGQMVHFFKMRRLISNGALQKTMEDKFGSGFYKNLASHLATAEGRTLVSDDVERSVNFVTGRIAVIGLTSPWTMLKMSMSFPLPPTGCGIPEHSMLGSSPRFQRAA